MMAAICVRKTRNGYSCHRLVLLVIAVAAIYLILRNMGAEGVEIAAPGSCKSGRCGVRCASSNHAQEAIESAPGDEEAGGHRETETV